MKIPNTRIEIVGHSPWSPKRQPFADVRHAPLSARIGWFFKEKCRLLEIRRATPAGQHQPARNGDSLIEHAPVTWSTLGNEPSGLGLQSLPANAIQMILDYVPSQTLFSLKKTSRYWYKAAEATLNSAPRRHERMDELRAKLRQVAHDCTTGGKSIETFQSMAKALLDRTVAVEINFADFSTEQRNALSAILTAKADLRHCSLVMNASETVAFDIMAKAISKVDSLESLEIDTRPAGVYVSKEYLDALCRLPKVTALFARNAATSNAFAPPQHATRLELENCYLSGNKIAGFEGSAAIRTLNLARNTALSDTHIARVVNSQPSLEHLNVSNTGSGSEALRAMGQTKTLRSADLSNCRNVDHVSIAHLNGHPAIEKLTLAGTRLSWSTLASLPRDLPRLQALDIGHTNGFRGGAYLTVPLPNIKTLKAANTGAGTHAASYLAASQHTSDLDLWDNRVGSRGAAALIGNGVLRHLGLGRNRLLASDRLLDAIRNARSLESLDLRENFFNKNDLQPLLEAAKANTSIKLLDLRGIDFNSGTSELNTLLQPINDARPDLKILISALRL